MEFISYDIIQCPIEIRSFSIIVFFLVYMTKPLDIEEQRFFLLGLKQLHIHVLNDLKWVIRTNSK